MTEEEKKITKRLKDDIALVTFNDNLNYGIGNLYVNINDLKIILNLISKLQADIEIKDKVIKKMSIAIGNDDLDYEDVCKYCEHNNEDCHGDYCVETRIEYFYKKVDEEKVLKKLKNKHTKESIILSDYIEKLEKEIEINKKSIEIMAKDIFELLKTKELTIEDIIYSYNCQALSILATNGEL